MYMYISVCLCVCVCVCVCVYCNIYIYIYINIYTYLVSRLREGACLREAGRGGDVGCEDVCGERDAAPVAEEEAEEEG